MTQMIGKIRPITFGINPDEYEQYATGSKELSVNGESCQSLTWNKEESLFNLNARLFDCNMNVVEVIYNNEP